MEGFQLFSTIPKLFVRVSSFLMEVGVRIKRMVNNSMVT